MGLLLAKRIPRGLKHTDIDDFDFVIGRSISTHPKLKVGDKAPKKVLESENFGGWLRRGYIKFAGKVPPKGLLLARKGFASKEARRVTSLPSFEDLVEAGYPAGEAVGIVATEEALADGASEDEAVAIGLAAAAAYLVATTDVKLSLSFPPEGGSGNEDGEGDEDDNEDEEGEDEEAEAATESSPKSPAEMSKAELRVALTAQAVPFDISDSKKKLQALLLGLSE